MVAFVAMPRCLLSHFAHRTRRGLIALCVLLAAPPAFAQTPAPLAAVPRGSAASPAPVSIWPVDPLTVVDDDFARNRDPALWQGLSVHSLYFVENGVTWHVWHIVNLAHPGPLWVVPHDNENATFGAGLIAVRSWGGSIMAVDTGASDDSYAARFNEGAGAGIDPNRNFRDELPLYAGAILGDLTATPQLVIALHTNAPGFDASQSICSAAPDSGSGDISIRLCSDRYAPSPSRSHVWPFDDEDSLAIMPWLASLSPASAFCGRMLTRKDFNLVFERVAISDGSLSNFAAFHGLRYINLETRDRGSSPAGIGQASARLVQMIDSVMENCGDIAPLAIHPAPPRPAPNARKRRLH